MLGRGWLDFAMCSGDVAGEYTEVIKCTIEVGWEGEKGKVGVTLLSLISL